MDALLLSGWLRQMSDQTQQLSISLPQELVMLLGNWMSTDCVHWIEVITDCIFDVVVSDNKDLINTEVASHIETLWNEVQDEVSRIRRWPHLYTLSPIEDSAAHFFREISRIGAADYIPHANDIWQYGGVSSTAEYYSLRLPFGKNKWDEVSFEYGRHHLQVLKVPTEELSKCMHCFNNMRFVIFMTSLGFYDNKESMLKSMELFKEICASQCTQNSGIILFLNKMDLFREKLRTTPLSTCFPQYQNCKQEDDNETKAIDYIREQFIKYAHADARDRFEHLREVHVHVISAADREDVRKVFGDAVLYPFDLMEGG